jgi:hypothetical protein
MSDEDIRRRVVNSFRNAIDSEQQNNDVVSRCSKLTFVVINVCTVVGSFRKFVCY